MRSHADELLAIVALESRARARRSSSARTWARSSRACASGWPRSACCRTGCCTSSRRRPSSSPSWRCPAITTHDLPTIAGLWTGADLEAQKRIGLRPNEDGTRGLRNKLRDLGGLDEHAAPELAIEATHRVLARAPSRILLATLDDAVATPDRPNMPGTINEWPNWSLPLPAPLEDIESAELPRHLARLLARE